ncbi:hypothetical protein HF086_006413 [Spodoptera exigua]|uniref:Gustatory receptor n=1 Tax=Spodoptera exigua TaxID=7107 RepID=A0A922MXT4_SPOEX|nr:hypothetical protein HF086_006413 [Spodoptera exigua]
MLTIKIEIWNNIAKNTNFDQTCDDECEIDLRRVQLKRMLKVMKLISEVWRSISEMSDLKIADLLFQILLHFVTTYIMFVMYVMTILIYAIRVGMTMNIIVSHVLGVTICLSKLLFVELLLCVACEEFYRKTNYARSIVIVKSSQNVELKRIWKNIRRLIDANLQKMSACGCFNLDAVTMVYFCSVITSHVIVLLQFAFL